MLGAQGASLIALSVFAYASWMSEDNCGAQENVLVGSSRWLRMSIFLLSSTLVGTCAIITLVSSDTYSIIFIKFYFQCGPIMFQLDTDLIKYSESPKLNETIEFVSNTTKLLNLTEDLTRWSSSSTISVSFACTNLNYS